MTHTHRRRTTVLVSLLAAAALILSACGSSVDSEGKEAGGSDGKVAAQTIGYVDIVANGGMQLRWRNFLNAAADKLGWKVELVDAGGVASKALQGVQQFVNKGVSAIVVSCVDTGPLVPGLKAAKAANIPVIALGCEVPEPVSEWTAVYAEQEEPLAQALADYMVDALREQKCNKVSVLQDNTILVGRLRSDFFLKALAAAGFEIVSKPVIPQTSIVPSTRTAVSAALSKDPDTCAIVSIFDFSSGPAVAQLKALGKAGDVGVYSYYADNVNLPLLLEDDSSLRGVVDGPVEQVSLVAVDQLLAFFEKDKAIDKDAGSKLSVDFEVITRENAPENVKGYITPWSADEYLAPYIEKWNKEYGLSLS